MLLLSEAVVVLICFCLSFRRSNLCPPTKVKDGVIRPAQAKDRLDAVRFSRLKLEVMLQLYAGGF